jgi:hypothetical protein
LTKNERTGDGIPVQNGVPVRLAGTVKLERISIALISIFIFAAFSMISHRSFSDNESSRLNLAYSIVLSGDLNIDEYHGNTIDKAFKDGHYYCDKAPGLSLAATPLLFIGKAMFPNRNWHPGDPATNYFLILILISLPSALVIPLMANAIKKIAGGFAVFPLIAYALGSLAFPYSTLFYDHQFSAVLLTAAFCVWLLGADNSKNDGISVCILGGFLIGYASISEYPSAAPGAILFLTWFFTTKSWKARIGLFAGIALPIILLAAYNNTAFGHPLKIGYFFETHPFFNKGMGQGVGGVTYPNLVALAKLVAAPQRGLLWGQPLILLAIPGVAALFRARGLPRLACALMVSFILARLIINASYYEPYGGFSPGPRFLVGSLPFLAILACVGWLRLPEITLGVAGGAGLFSIAHHFTISAIDPHVPQLFQAPIFHYIIPLMIRGFEPNTLINGLYAGFFAPLTIIIAAGLWLILRDIPRGFRADEIVGIVVGFLALSALFMSSAIILEPSASESSYYLGAAFNRNKQYRQASEQFMMAVSERPDYEEAWHGLGIAEIKSGNYNEAIESFGRAVALDPSSVQNRISLSAALLMSGRPGAAANALQPALDAFPEHPDVRSLHLTIESMSRAKQNE